MVSRSGKHVKAALSLGGDMMLAPMVAAMRMPKMAMEMPGPLGLGGEAMGAVTEKLDAVAEGLAAAQLSYLSSMMLFWPEALSGRTPSLLSGVALERSLHAALAPSGKRVRANYRRLSKR